MRESLQRMSRPWRLMSPKKIYWCWFSVQVPEHVNKTPISFHSEHSNICHISINLEQFHKSQPGCLHRMLLSLFPSLESECCGFRSRPDFDSDPMYLRRFWSKFDTGKHVSWDGMMMMAISWPVTQTTPSLVLTRCCPTSSRPCHVDTPRVVQRMVILTWPCFTALNFSGAFQNVVGWSTWTSHGSWIFACSIQMGSQLTFHDLLACEDFYSWRSTSGMKYGKIVCVCNLIS